MSQDMFANSGSSSSLRTSSAVGSQPSQPFSGVREVADGSSDIDENASYDDDVNLFCSRCAKQFKIKKGYLNHKFAHMSKDSMNNVSEGQLPRKTEALAGDILNQMLQEQIPGDFGEERKSFIDSVLGKTLSEEWSHFVNQVSMPIIKILISMNSKILPPKQYEENLTNFNMWLCDDVNVLSLTESLISICDSGRNDFLINNVVYRFCTLMFKSLNVECLRMMQTPKALPGPANECPSVALSQDEKQTLYYASGYILRTFLRKGSKYVNNSTWKKRVRCVKERCLFDENGQLSQALQEVKSWYDMLDRGGLTPSSENFFEFLLGVELLIRGFETYEVSYDKDKILNSLFCFENRHLLEIWYSLTSGIMSESESLYFLDKVVHCHVKFSSRAAAGLVMREASKEVRKVALRTDLKRN